MHIWWAKNLFLFLYRAVQRIYSSEIPLAYAQVGVVSSGSGAGHCAGANRPGGLVDIVINYDNDDIDDNGDDKNMMMMIMEVVL